MSLNQKMTGNKIGSVLKNLSGFCQVLVDFTIIGAEINDGRWWLTLFFYYYYLSIIIKL